MSSLIESCWRVIEFLAQMPTDTKIALTIAVLSMAATLIALRWLIQPLVYGACTRESLVEVTRGAQEHALMEPARISYDYGHTSTNQAAENGRGMGPVG